MKIVIKGNPEEIVDFIGKVQGQQAETICFEPQIDVSAENALDQEKILRKLSWGMRSEVGSQNVDVFPMNGEKIVIHGKHEADFFCKMLTDYFR